jgi:hypothetical protein
LAFSARQTLFAASIEVIDAHPPPQERLANPQDRRKLTTWDALRNQIKGTTPELRRR